MNLESRELKNINKPARYVGGEVNQIIKSGSKVKSNIILCYPNVYEKAMSNYIINLLYNNINDIEGIYCKRCFAPDMDFEKLLRDKNELLYSLEDFKPIKDSDLLIFVIDNELDYTNFLNILELSKIAVNKEDRTEIAPKVLIFPLKNINIKPIEKFADIILESENEKSNMKKILRYLKSYEESNFNKDILLNVEKNIQGYEDVKIKYDKNYIIPSIKIDEFSIVVDLEEVKDIDKTIKYIKDSIKNMGVTKVSFINQDKIENYKFCELVYKIKMNIEDVRILTKNLDFSKFDIETLRVILECMEKSILNFNVITCSNKLNNKIKLGMLKEDLLEKIICIFKNNRSSLKLIFNIGLPNETYEDIDNIFDIAEEIVNIYSQSKAKDKLSIIINIDYYIPKNKESYNVNSINKLETKLRYIKEKKCDPVIIWKLANINKYVTNILLKNGNEDISNVILSAYNLGARFDRDDIKYNKSAWDKAIFDHM